MDLLGTITDEPYDGPRRSNGLQGRGSESGTERLHLLGHFRQEGNDDILLLDTCVRSKWGIFTTVRKTSKGMERFPQMDNTTPRKFLFGLTPLFKFQNPLTGGFLEHVTRGGKQERGERAGGWRRVLDEQRPNEPYVVRSHIFVTLVQTPP
jgi:hypothetical protein